MTGENFKWVNRGTDAKKIKDEISRLERECGQLIQDAKEAEEHLDWDKYSELLRQIEWQEYLLSGC